MQNISLNSYHNVSTTSPDEVVENCESLCAVGVSGKYK